MSGFKPVYSWERLYGIINKGVKDSTASPPEEKTEGTQQFKNHANNKKWKTKVEKETQNTSSQQSSQQSRRQIHKG